MAQKRLDQLSQITTADDADLMLLRDQSAGSDNTKAITVANLFSGRNLTIVSGGGSWTDVTSSLDVDTGIVFEYCWVQVNPATPLSGAPVATVGGCLLAANTTPNSDKIIAYKFNSALSNVHNSYTRCRAVNFGVSQLFRLTGNAVISGWSGTYSYVAVRM